MEKEDYMGSNNPWIAIEVIRERLIRLDEKASAASQAAHTRIDSLDLVVQKEINEMKVIFADTSKELKDVVAFMNRGRGWAAAFVLLSSILGGVVANFIGK